MLNSFCCYCRASNSCLRNRLTDQPTTFKHRIIIRICIPVDNKKSTHNTGGLCKHSLLEAAQLYKKRKPNKFTLISFCWLNGCESLKSANDCSSWFSYRCHNGIYNMVYFCVLFTNSNIKCSIVQCTTPRQHTLSHHLIYNCFFPQINRLREQYLQRKVIENESKKY